MFPSLAAKVGGKAGGSLVARISKGVAIAVAVVTIFAVLLVGGMIAAMAGGGDGDGEGEFDCSRPVDTNALTVIPGFLMPIYEHASQEVDRAPDGTVIHKELGPRGVWILAAMNFIESDFGENMGPSDITGDGVGDPDGAHGWMQFIPSTWEIYGVDANGDGRKDPYNPHDAIHASARMLRASGAPENWLRAVHSYNPGAAEVEGDPTTNWYARKVMAQAEAFQGSCEYVVGDLDIGELDFEDTSGPWEGTMKFARALASLGKPFGCIAMQPEKRETRDTASGGISDHWVGAKNAYAIDIAGGECSLDYPGGDADRTARAIAKALNFPVSGGELLYAGDCLNQNRGRYRFQLIWQTQCGGDHTDHVHIGVRLLVEGE